MLSMLRKSAAGWVAKILISLLILSFGVWGVQGLILTNTNPTLAKVGDVEISGQDFQKIYPTIVNEWNQRLKQQLTREQIKAFDVANQARFRLINQAVVDNHALGLKLGVSDNAIGDAIQNDPQLKDGTGTFNKELLKQILRSERISEKQYFDEQRSSAVRTQITSIFTQKKVIPAALIDGMYHYREDKVEFDYFVVPEGAAPKAGEPDESALKSLYESSKDAYEAPEYRKVGLYVLSLEELKKTAVISEDDVKATYAARSAQFNVPESRVYSQIVFETMEKALEAHKALNAKKSLDEVAKEFGQGGKADPVGPVTKKSMADAKLADAIFAIKEGEYTAPVEGTFAITIAKVTKVTAAVEKTLEDVRPDIEAALKERAARKDIKTLFEKVEDLRASGMSVLNVAKEMKGTGLTIAALDEKGLDEAGKKIENLPPTKNLLASVFDASIGDDTVSVRHNDGGYVWYDVLGITPKHIKPYDDVKAKVKEAWIATETKKLAADFTANLTKEIEDKSNFDAVAKRLNAKIVSPKPLGRGAVEQDIPAFFTNRLFSVKPDGIASGLDVKNKNWVIVKLKKFIAAKTEGPAFEAYKKKLNDELQSEMTNDLVSEYLDGAKTHFGVEENNQLFEQLKNAL